MGEKQRQQFTLTGDLTCTELCNESNDSSYSQIAELFGFVGEPSRKISFERCCMEDFRRLRLPVLLHQAQA